MKLWSSADRHLRLQRPTIKYPGNTDEKTSLGAEFKGAREGQESSGLHFCRDMFRGCGELDSESGSICQQDRGEEEIQESPKEYVPT